MDSSRDLHPPTAPASSNDAPRQDSYSTPLTHPIPVPCEDEEEWEYEYSTTETETFYVTLDLTTPRDPTEKIPEPVPASKNSAPKMSWNNPAFSGRKSGGKRRHIYEIKTFALNRDGDKAEDKDGEKDENVKAAEEGSPEEPTSPEEPVPSTVQILDLHTENPIVSYNGKVFSCSWASNIGTELLFTEHDDSSDLPILRSLQDDVDLLAASSVRIVSKPMELEPKPHSATNGRQGSSKKQKSHGLKYIDVAGRTDPKTIGQAKFLERLMQIKKNKGEEDEVTIRAHVKRNARTWQQEWGKHLAKEKTKVRRIMNSVGGAEAESARKRLEELEELERVRTENMQKPRSRKSGSGKRAVDRMGVREPPPRKKRKVERAVTFDVEPSSPDFSELDNEELEELDEEMSEGGDAEVEYGSEEEEDALDDEE